MKRDKLSEKTEAFNDHLVALKEAALKMYEHSKKAVQTIVAGHTENYPNRHCSTYLEWHNPNNPFSFMKGQCAKCTQKFDTLSNKPECSSTECVSPNVSGGQAKALQLNTFCMGEYKRDFIAALKKDLETYWDLEMIQIAENWKKVADKAAEEVKRMSIPEKEKNYVKKV